MIEKGRPLHAAGFVKLADDTRRPLHRMADKKPLSSAWLDPNPPLVATGRIYDTDRLAKRAKRDERESGRMQ